MAPISRAMHHLRTHVGGERIRQFQTTPSIRIDLQDPTDPHFRVSDSHHLPTIRSSSTG